MRARRAAVIAAVLGAAVLVGLAIYRASAPDRRPGPGGPLSVQGEGEIVSVDLYFADSEGRRLALERRDIAFGTASGVALLEYDGAPPDYTADDFDRNYP